MPMEKTDSEIFSFNSSNIDNNSMPVQYPQQSKFTPWFFKYGLMAVIFFVLIINIYVFKNWKRCNNILFKQIF